MTNARRGYHLIIVFVALLYTQFVAAQDFDNYRILRNGNSIPEGTFSSLPKKIDAEMATPPDSTSRLTMEQRHEFVVGNSVMVDQLFKSGLVLFDDPVGQYLNHIKDYLLRDDPVHRDMIKVYLVRTSQVNAFATTQGQIFVHLGIMARVENEAVLAFVLAHEIQHVIKQHSFRDFEQKVRLQDEFNLNRRNGLDDFLAARNLFSRGQETEADSLGFELFLQSGYALSAVDHAMDLLKYSYLPLNLRPWDTTFLALDPIQLPPRFVPDSIPEVSADEEEADSDLSHPNIGTRRRGLEAQRAQVAEVEGRDYIIGSEEFARMRDICQFELCHALLASESNQRAIWTAFQLKGNHPESTFLDWVLVHGLYRMAKLYAVVGTATISQRGSMSGLQGDFYHLCHFFTEVKGEELAVIALKYAWKTHLRQPDREDVTLICEDLAGVMLRHYPTGLKRMEGAPAGVQAKCGRAEAINKANEEAMARQMGVYYQNREAKKKDTVTERSFHLGAFAEEFTSEDFVALFDSVDPDEDQGIFAKVGFSDALDYYRKLRRGYRLGIDKIVYAPIQYSHVDLRKDVPFLYRETEAERSAYVGYMEEIASNLGLQIEILDYERDASVHVEEILLLRRWMADAMSTLRFGGAVNLYHDSAKELRERFGTDYVGLNAMLITQFRQKGQVLDLIENSIILYPVFPFVIYLYLKAGYESEYINLVFDIRDGNLKMLEYRSPKLKARPRMIKSSLYSTILQIHSPEKK